ncbi:MAG: SGNH/GDSL hydrolase family protein, partial [Candidatus Dadabacteria bacterium]
MKIPFKTFFVNFLLLVFGLISAFLLVEIYLRFFYKEPSPWLDRPQYYYAHSLSTTFQDYPYPEKKEKGKYRIAVIGDSFTFGAYVQFFDAFPKKLETILNLNSREKKVEVINYGVPGYSTSHEVSLVKKAIQDGADLVIVQLTLNDPELKPY